MKSEAEIITIKRAFQELLRRPEGDEAIEQVAQMISFAFLGEIEKTLERRNLNKKELAKKAGVSASYITQLYRGHKMVNMPFLARVATSTNIRFQISAVDEEQPHDLDERTIQDNEETIIDILNRKKNMSGCWLYHNHYENMDAVYDPDNTTSSRKIELTSAT